MTKYISTLILLAILPITHAHAEYLGLPYGRSADISSHAELAVEGGVQLGDIDNFMARASLKLNDRLSLYGDLGFSDADHSVGSDSGVSFGGGAVFGLGQLAEGVDFGGLASLHLASTGDLDWTDLAFRVIASGELPVQDIKAAWYGSLGIEFLDVSVDNCRICDADDTEFAFGGGIIYPIGPGEAYGGLDYVDDLTIGGGYRISLR